MIFDPATGSHLKPWLVRTLEPICDAEPGALADYILALLKHNVPESEMRKELAVQLDEFLEKECTPFIDTLFTVLRTKSYLPYSAASPSTSYTSPNQSMDTGIPIPLDGLLSPSIPNSPDRGQKRSIDNDERDGRPPAKGPRLSNEGQFSRYSNGRGRDTRSTGGWAARGDRSERPGMNGQGEGVMNPNMAMGAMNGGMGMNGSMGMGQLMNGRSAQPYQPPDPRRGICRDYHNSGYCARGAFCKYSHGEDAVVPGQLFPMNGPVMPGPMPFMPMFPNGGVPFGMGAVGGTYDPHEARMDMRPQGGPMNGGGRPQIRTPLLPRIQQEDGSQVVHSLHASGELPVIQDLTPNLTQDENSQPQNEEEFGSRNGQVGGPDGSMDVQMAPIMAPPVTTQGGFRGGPWGGGRGRDTFSSEAHKFRPERRHDKTLVVEKIPEDKMSLEHVNGWFKRFGTVTNVAIDVAKAKALISFSNHDEAHAAWKSEDAVFNNRFVKLFWHRPMEGHGQAGARMLAASAPLVANMAKETPVPVPVSTAAPSAAPTTSVTSRKASTPSAAASALAAKQQLLEQQIAEQRSLMASLETASSEEKKQIMARLRKLGEEMKPMPAGVPLAATAPSQAPKIRATPTSRPDDHERKERERLDKELELHHASLAVEGGAESTEDLKAKLEKLKAEAASLGLPEATAESSYGGSHRPYRGRGRGVRSYYRRGAAHGGPPRASMKLDNRPKKLLIKSVSDGHVQAVRDWYEATGQIESVETMGGDIVVAFRSRGAAEQGLAKGHNIPGVGPVKVSWFTGPQSNTDAIHKSPASLDIKDDKITIRRQAQSPDPEPHLSPHAREEEVVASGWGGDGDGEEDGMGML